MATNITSNTVNRIQTLVHDAFDTTAILDRVKTVLTSSLGCPIISNMVHMLAHKYTVNMGDGVGDLIEKYNEEINYGDIEEHIEDYSSIKEAMNKVLDSVLTYQNELNVVYKEIFNNGDIHVLEGLSKVIKEHNKYVETVITWKDIVDRYGDNPSVDVDLKKYDFK